MNQPDIVKKKVLGICAARERRQTNSAPFSSVPKIRCYPQTSFAGKRRERNRAIENGAGLAFEGVSVFRPHALKAVHTGPDENRCSFRIVIYSGLYALAGF